MPKNVCRCVHFLARKTLKSQWRMPLFIHADVRRMLLTQKAIAEGGRSMIYYAAQIADKMADALERGDTAAFEAHDDHLGFYTPILKGFLTELGLEAANHGMQVYGGHGYIKEWGMEQIARMHVLRHMKAQQVFKH